MILNGLLDIWQKLLGKIGELGNIGAKNRLVFTSKYSGTALREGYMDFENFIRDYRHDIKAVIQQYRRQWRDWRMEFEDLWQEALLALWEAKDALAMAENKKAYCKTLVATRMKKLYKRCEGDALYHASNYGLNPGTALEIEDAR